MNIDTEKGLIEAKSEHENYVKEASGVKPNTVRIVTAVEANWLRSLESSILDEDQAVTIVITDVETEDNTRRQVTDISFVGTLAGHEITVISWRHVSMEETK